MKIGYVRTSTPEQVAGFEAQVEELKQVGCEKLYQEQVSSSAQRDQLSLALDFIRQGDTLVVTKLDRLARSTKHLGINTSSSTGELVLILLGAVAQFERQIDAGAAT